MNKRPMNMNNGMRQNNNNNKKRKMMNRGSDHHHGNQPRQRKNASASREKYLNLAREAQSSGDRVLAEYYLQHADHYYRVMMLDAPHEQRQHGHHHHHHQQHQQAEADTTATEVAPQSPAAPGEMASSAEGNA